MHHTINVISVEKTKDVLLVLKNQHQLFMCCLLCLLLNTFLISWFTCGLDVRPHNLLDLVLQERMSSRLQYSLSGCGLYGFLISCKDVSASLLSINTHRWKNRWKCDIWVSHWANKSMSEYKILLGSCRKTQGCCWLLGDRNMSTFSIRQNSVVCVNINHNYSTVK